MLTLGTGASVLFLAGQLQKYEAEVGLHLECLSTFKRF